MSLLTVLLMQITQQTRVQGNHKLESSCLLIALKNAFELVVSLRYKLRMYGIPMEGATNMFCDNEAVYKNASTPEYVYIFYLLLIFLNIFDYLSFFRFRKKVKKDETE